MTRNMCVFACLLMLLFEIAPAQYSALEFRSNAGQYVSMGDVLNPGTNNFTVEAVVSIDSFPPIADYGAKIFNKGLSTSGTPVNSGYGLRVWEDNGDNRIIFMFNDGSSFYRLSSGKLSTHTCYHLAAVRDSNEYKLYIDGQLVADTVLTTSLNIQTNLVFALGALSRSPVDLTTEFLDGSIREFRIWNTARSAGQINALMNDTLTVAWYGSPDSGVAAYYRCDRLEDIGIGGDGVDDIRDLSVNGYHGTSFGSPQIVTGCAVTDIGYNPHHKPEIFSLLQNYPNPFNAMTVIRYTLPEALRVDISIYDLLGRRISQFSRGTQPAGNHNFRYDAGSLPGGIYFYHLRAGQFSDTGKMILIK